MGQDSEHSLPTRPHPALSSVPRNYPSPVSLGGRYAPPQTEAPAGGSPHLLSGTQAPELRGGQEAFPQGSPGLPKLPRGTRATEAEAAARSAGGSSPRRHAGPGNSGAPGGADGGVGETITDNATETIAQNANGMPVAPPVVSDKAKGPGSGGSAGSGSSVREVFGLPASQTVGAPSNSARSRWGMQTAKIIEQNREARSSEAWRGLLDSPELANQLEGVRGLWEHKIKRGSLSNANSPMNRPSQETRSSSSAVQPEEQQPPLILSRRQSPLSSPLQKRENPLPPIPGMPHLLPTPAAPAQAP